MKIAGIFISRPNCKSPQEQRYSSCDLVSHSRQVQDENTIISGMYESVSVVFWYRNTHNFRNGCTSIPVHCRLSRLRPLYCPAQPRYSDFTLTTHNSSSKSYLMCWNAYSRTDTRPQGSLLYHAMMQATICASHDLAEFMHTQIMVCTGDICVVIY